MPGMAYGVESKEEGARLLQKFLSQDNETPYIYADWPDDISYFCKSLITGPGMMVNIPALKFELVRIDAYPTTLEDAVRHNAYWDAKALMAKLKGL